MIVFMSNLPDHPESLGLTSLNLTANGMIIPLVRMPKSNLHFVIKGILNIETRTMQT
jgi:hypothetical protein